MVKRPLGVSLGKCRGECECRTCVWVWVMSCGWECGVAGLTVGGGWVVFCVGGWVCISMNIFPLSKIASHRGADWSSY